MSVAEISHQIQSIGFLTYIRESGYTYPMILSTHLATIAIFGGLILMTDLRILGLAMKSTPIADVVKTLRPWKHLGLLIMVTMGLLLATSEMDKYYGNPYFQMKMSLLILVIIHSIVFRGVYRNPEALDKAPQVPGIAKAAAISSLCLWIGIACCGRWIAYYEPKDKDKPVTSLTVPAPPQVVATR
ncbi:MAG TPA: DUF6644 family protein [Bryobacteraceae bacterium]|jgi:hypothetical protein